MLLLYIAATGSFGLADSQFFAVMSRASVAARQ